MAVAADGPDPASPLPRAALPSLRGNGLSAPLLAVIFGPAVLLFASTALVTLRTGIDPSFFVRDPSSTLGGHPLTGMQSHLGVLAWWATKEAPKGGRS